MSKRSTKPPRRPAGRERAARPRRAGRAAVVLGAIACTAAQAAPAAGQTIRGWLLDAGTDQPIAAANMILLTPDSAFVASALTDSAGVFTITADTAGEYRLQADRIGYRAAVTTPIPMEAEDTLSVEFRLSIDAVLLEPLTVLAERTLPGAIRDFYERARGPGPGEFVTRADIERLNPIHVSDVLRRIPGVHTAPARGGFGVQVLLRGRCQPRVYMDGIPITMGASILDDLASPGMVEGVEIYRGASEVPAQYNRPDGTCGVIIIWTRAPGT